MPGRGRWGLTLIGAFSIRVSTYGHRLYYMVVVSLVRDYEEYNLLLRHFDPVTNPITYNIYIVYSLTFLVRLPILHRT